MFQPAPWSYSGILIASNITSEITDFDIVSLVHVFYVY